MKRFIVAAFLLLAAVDPLWAQAGLLPAWNVVGNPTAAQGQQRGASLTTLFDGAFCNTSGSILLRTTSWVCGAPGTGLAFSGTSLNLQPSALATIGGVKAINAVSHQWINAISTAGVPSLTQPAFTDISGTLAATQCPNPSASTIGCVESLAAVSHQWINAISTAGVPSATQPAVGDLQSIAADNVVGNFTGSSAAPGTGALTSCSGASSAVTYNTSTHAFGCNTISAGGNPSFLSASAGNPTGTTSSTGVMMGVGSTCTITPAVRTRIKITVSGQIANSTNNDAAVTVIRFGTGTAPVNGAALTGTATVGAQSVTNNASTGGLTFPFSATAIASGLTLSTTYWIDVSLQIITGGTATLTNIVCVAVEI